MRNQPSNALLLILAVFLIAGCSTAGPTESPGASPAEAVPLTVESTKAPRTPTATVAPTATAVPTADAPTPQRTPTAKPPAATPTERPTATVSAPTATRTTEPTATPLPTPASPTVTLGVDDVVAALANLSFEEFLEESYKQLLLRSPRKITELGLSASYGLRNDRLDDLSEAHARETQRLEAAVLEMLRGYDRAALGPEVQISYDVYEWYLDDRVRSHEFTYHDYAVNHFINGYAFRLNELLTDLHPLENRHDAEDYIARLSQVDDQVAQLLEHLSRQEEMGIVAPEFILWLAKQEILGYLAITAADLDAIHAPSLSVYTVFSDAVVEMDGLTADEKLLLRESALDEIRNGYIPALLDLLSTIDHQMSIATDDAGAWKLPDGDAYYAQALRRETSTDLSAEQIHAIGLAEVARIQGELREVFDDLGYPQDRPVGELIQRAIGDGGTLDSSQVLGTYEAILADIDQRVEVAFDVRPQAGVVVVVEPGFGGYYTAGAADGSRPAAFHATGGGSGTNKAEMRTTAYHEAVPGHHFQIALAQEMEHLPTFRRHEFFNANVEGWALYAERLAWELGAYEDDPYGNVGRLRLELLRAARLVVDTGIHAKGWTREQARAYLAENVGGWTHEVERYVAWPAQATGYMVGMVKILELRQRAMDELGDRFDLKEFHNVVLGNGSLPLSILERLVDEYIAAKQ